MKTLAEYIADACEVYGMNDKQTIEFLTILRAIIAHAHDDLDEIQEEP